MSEFPDRYETTGTVAEAKAAPEGSQFALAGRIRLARVMGGLAFAQIQDQSGIMQISLHKGEPSVEAFAEWKKQLKLGTFVGVRGETWVTKTGELTLRVADLVVLGVSRHSFPDKWQGVTDPEQVYRRRFLDLLLNEESRRRFVTRTRIIQGIRRRLDDAGFFEIETPTLLPAASGAAARPFVTHHNALDIDLFLRIAPETYLKRAVAGGFDRVYELGKNFRNEGMDPSHLQEFTMVEWYAAYWNYRDNMEFTSRLISETVREATGSYEVEVEGRTLNFALPWPEVDYRTALHEHTGIDISELTEAAEVAAAAKGAGIELGLAPGASYATAVDRLYKLTLRPTLVQPCFLVRPPRDLAPLARANAEDPSIVDMFQVLISGWEVVKGYSELVDPVEQRERLMEQVALKDAGDDEAMALEEDFLEAMEFGMPPMSGVGLGIDRLIALLTGAPSLRDIVLFPNVREVVAAPAPADDAG